MSSTCNHKGCCRDRVPNNPFCRTHAIHFLLSSLKDKEPRTVENVIKCAAISRTERLIMNLIYVEQFTQKEISFTLDLSESSVRKMHHKFVDRLYPHLRSACEVLYPFTPDLQEEHIVRIREFSKELITNLAKHPKYLYNIHHRDFERLIAHILETIGFEVQLTAPVRDGGCDIIAFSTDDLGIKTKYIVECKRYRPNRHVGVRLVRSLSAVKGTKRAHHAVLATTSYFTRDAIVFAQDPLVFGLHLKDFDEITRWLRMCASKGPAN
jgi:Restriction endonuclease/Sigma-70, region 4